MDSSEPEDFFHLEKKSASSFLAFLEDENLQGSVDQYKPLLPLSDQDISLSGILEGVVNEESEREDIRVELPATPYNPHGDLITIGIGTSTETGRNNQCTQMVPHPITEAVSPASVIICEDGGNANGETSAAFCKSILQAIRENQEKRFDRRYQLELNSLKARNAELQLQIQQGKKKAGDLLLVNLELEKALAKERYENARLRTFLAPKPAGNPLMTGTGYSQGMYPMPMQNMQTFCYPQPTMQNQTMASFPIVMQPSCLVPMNAMHYPTGL